MIDGPFRTVLPRFTTPLIRLYLKLGLTPNLITLLALVLGFVAAFLCAIGASWGAMIVWWFGRLFDGTDGIFARETGQSSAFGAYLDIVSDMCAYSVMILGFSILHPDLASTWAVILVLYVLCITSALAFGSMEATLHRPAHDNRGLRLGAGLAEGGETGIAYSAFLIFPSHVPWLTKIWISSLIVTVLSRTLMAARLRHN
jgi:phosphatidylglycerophosphate synthase